MKPRTAASRCPTCGARAMRPTERDVEVRVGKRVVVVRGVSIEECSACGERLYDLAALHRIGDAKRAARRHAA
jgi:YgiT-type zinc finger domain-containing protein